MDPKSASTTTSRLSVGDVFLREKKEYVVWFVSESRASVSPLEGKIEHRTREDDGKILFMGSDAEHISPNSELKIERSLGRKGLAELLEKRKTETPETTTKKTNKMKTKKDKKESTSASGIRAGKLGTFEGYSIASVIRTFAKHGWTFRECRAFLDKQKIAASDQTIKLNIYRGVRGVDGEYAPIKESRVKELRPKLPPEEKKSKKETKPAKTAKATKAAKKNEKPKSKTEPAKSKSRAAEQLAALKAKSKEAPEAAKA